MIRRLLPMVAAAGLAGCGGSPPPPSFPPLDYSYLPPITLRVATINVVNGYTPDPGAATLLGQDPETPGDALTGELNHRLLPSGAPGNATATIETASIDQIGGNLTGTLTVQVNVSSADGLRTGYTEASVTQSDPAPDPTSSETDVQAALYQLTKELMNQMNVQLQYQVEHNLGSWVVNGPGAGAASGAPASGIEAAPLGPPSAAAPGAPASSQSLPGGLPTGPATGLTPEGPSPIQLTPTPTPTAIPPGPPAASSGPIPLTPPAAPGSPAPPASPAAPTISPTAPATPAPSTQTAPATPAPFNPANVGL